MMTSMAPHCHTSRRWMMTSLRLHIETSVEAVEAFEKTKLFTDASERDRYLWNFHSHHEAVYPSSDSRRRYSLALSINLSCSRFWYGMRDSLVDLPLFYLGYYYGYVPEATSRVWLVALIVGLPSQQTHFLAHARRRGLLKSGREPQGVADDRALQDNGGSSCIRTRTSSTTRSSTATFVSRPKWLGEPADEPCRAAADALRRFSRRSRRRRATGARARGAQGRLSKLKILGPVRRGTADRSLTPRDDASLPPAGAPTRCCTLPRSAASAADQADRPDENNQPRPVRPHRPTRPRRRAASAPRASRGPARGVGAPTAALLLPLRLGIRLGVRRARA